ncbi:MAG TPA: regulatory protein RecX [Thermoanaerobaculia bacterium]|nr:regulatory protein RecX [Thermoanaerobaculia bacterium]
MKGAYEKAVDLLSARPHFRRELAVKLAARRFPAAEIEAALDRLTEERYLDDRATAESFVRSRLERGPEGRLRLAAELGRRGAPAEVAAETLDALLPEDDLAAARAAAARWARGGKDDPAALSRHLARKGFSPRAIFTLLRERGAEPPAEDG